MQGTVKAFNTEKYYGYIQSDNREDYFFHQTDYQGNWDELVFDYHSDDRKIPVEFYPDKTNKGLRARNVFRTDIEREMEK